VNQFSIAWQFCYYCIFSVRYQHAFELIGWFFSLEEKQKKICWPSADVLCSCMVDVRPFGLKIDTPVTPTLGSVCRNILTPFCFRVTSMYRMGRHRRSGGWLDGRNV